MAAVKKVTSISFSFSTEDVQKKDEGNIKSLSLFSGLGVQYEAFRPLWFSTFRCLTGAEGGGHWTLTTSPLEHNLSTRCLVLILSKSFQSCSQMEKRRNEDGARLFHRAQRDEGWPSLLFFSLSTNPLERSKPPSVFPFSPLIMWHLSPSVNKTKHFQPYRISVHAFILKCLLFSLHLILMFKLSYI